MAAPKVTINLPNLLKAYGGSSAVINPHHNDVRQQSSAWLRSYEVLSKEKLASYESHNSELLASLAYPYADCDQLRLVCDCLNLLFVLDDTTDHQSIHAAEVMCSMLLGALKGLPMDANSNFSKLAVDFSTRYKATATSASALRFTAHTESFLASVVTQARFRKNSDILGLNTFISHRRDNSATLMCFDLVELALGITLPCEVYASTEFMAVYYAASDMIWLSNDIYSYSMEKLIRHHEYNAITVYMKEFDLDIQAAFDRTGREFDTLWTQFNTNRLALPTFGEDVDLAVQQFIDALKTWVIGNLHWSFETPRYFGDMKDLVKATHTIVV